MRITLTNTLFATASAVLTAGALLMSVPAMAATTTTTDGAVLTRQAQVTYADLDLASPAARATLKNRIHAAASSVCAVDDSDLESRLASAACRKQAISEATRRMDTMLAQAATTKRIAQR